MNLQDYNFPELTGLDIAFSTLKTDPFLLELAKERGFYNGNTPYNRLFSDLFYSGGSLTFKCSITEEFKKKAIPYLKAFMGSFEPKHEEKEAICSLILSELCTYLK